MTASVVVVVVVSREQATRTAHAYTQALSPSSMVRSSATMDISHSTHSSAHTCAAATGCATVSGRGHRKVKRQSGHASRQTAVVVQSYALQPSSSPRPPPTSDGRTMSYTLT